MNAKRDLRALPLLVLTLVLIVVGVPQAATAAATSDIIVQLDGTPTGVARARAGDSFDAAGHIASLRARQDRLLERLAAAGIDASVLTTPVEKPEQEPTTRELRYFWAVNGLALRVPAGSEAAIARVPGVVHVEPEREVRPVLDTSVPYTRASTVWEDYGYRGEGVDVGVIDGGIAWDHPAFTTNPAIPPGPAHPKVKKYYSFTAGLSDSNGHGTHVAGIVAADSSLGHATTNPVSGYGASLLDGMAPKANLFGYKTHPGVAGTTFAVDQSVADGADVINLSAVSPLDELSNSALSVALANAMAAGTFAAVAAGNYGPGYSTIWSPATAQAPLSVGSSTDPGNNQRYLIDRADSQRFALNLIQNSPAPPTSPPIEERYVYVGEGCTPLDYATRASVRGRIALVKRGTCHATVKKELAQQEGAAAAIIFNTVAGNFSLPMTRSRIVVGALSKADGEHLLGDGHLGPDGLSLHTVQFDPDFDSHAGQVSGFSSRGPTADFRIKPDIVAPGDRVTSAVPQGVESALPSLSPFFITDPSGYRDAGGTSMAAPHMAGAAALLRQAKPDWTTRELKAAFMNTARQLIEPKDGQPYSIMDQGAGLVDVRAAIDTPAVILDPSHSFQRVCSVGEPVSESHEFAIVDKSGSAGTWSLAWQDGDGKNRNGQGRTLPARGWSQSFSTSSVSVPANGSARFGFTITIAGGTLAEGDYEGYIVATGGGVTLRVPVFARHEHCLERQTAPVLADPGATSTGSYTLGWSNVTGEVGYRVQQSTNYAMVFSDGAEAGPAGKWTTQATPNGWQQDCTLNAKSDSCSYWSLNSDERNATLTLASPVSVPAGTELTLTFASYEDTEPAFDFAHVEASDDNGATWTGLFRATGTSGGWVERRVVTSRLSGNVLIRFRYQTDGAVSAPLYRGWSVDDISISMGNWAATGDAGADTTSLPITQESTGTYYHRVAGLYGDATEPAIGPWSNIVDITVDRPVTRPDLQVTAMAAGKEKPREGEKVKVTATVMNTGDSAAGASKTEFLLDGSAVLGGVETPALAPGATAEVSVLWDTRGVKGEHTIRATADHGSAVAESSEVNNAGVLKVTVKGNKVENGQFEQSDASGSGPAAWSGASGSGGTTWWGDGGSDGSKAASVSGNGGSTAAGSPTWTSDPVAVSAGETLELVVSVKATDASSAATVGLAYVGAAGELLGTVRLITAPLTTAGVQTLEQTVTVPAGVAQARVVLTGFAPSDTSTRGTVTFDDVGLYSP